MRLIDADVLKEYIDKENNEDKVSNGFAFFLKKYIDAAPTVEAIPLDKPRLAGKSITVEEILENK